MYGVLMMLCRPSVCVGRLAAALALPHHRRRRLAVLGRQLEQHRAVVERRDQQPVAVQPRRGDRQVRLELERLRPVDLARLRVEAVDRLRRPDDELAHAADGVDDRRTVADLFRLHRQRPPFLGAGVLVESHDDAVVAADQAYKLVAVEQRRRGEAPHRHRRLVRLVLDEILGPNVVAGRGVVTMKIAHRAQEVDLAAADGRRGPRAGRVGKLVGAGVRFLPEDAAVGFLQTPQAFLAVHAGRFERVAGVFRARRQDAVGDVDFAVGHGGAGVAAADRHPPALLGAVLGEVVEDSAFPPDAVAPRPEPLRPVVGVGGAVGGKKQAQGEKRYDQRQSAWHGTASLRKIRR